MKREIQEILAAIFCVAYFMTSWIDITVERGEPYIIKVTKKSKIKISGSYRLSNAMVAFIFHTRVYQLFLHSIFKWILREGNIRYYSKACKVTIRQIRRIVLNKQSHGIYHFFLYREVAYGLPK